MKELTDYSGPFKPDLKYEDLSKDFIIKLIEEYAKSYMRLSEPWITEFAKRRPIQESDEYEMTVWDKLASVELPLITKRICDIKVENMIDAIKVVSWSPDVIYFVYHSIWEIIDENTVILTVSRCNTVRFYEKNNMIDRIKMLCEVMERRILVAWFNYLLPPPIADAVPLKVPPRKSQDEIYCRWYLKRREKDKYHGDLSLESPEIAEYRRKRGI